MPENLNEFLYRHKLLKSGEKTVWRTLAGGVSSDIWRVDLPRQTICVKRALANLKVAAVWRAPVERNNYEWEWFKFAYEKFPELVPRPIAHDAEMQMLAMEFLAPEDYTVWKKELLEGIADGDFAGSVGTALGKLHAASAKDENLEKTFATDDLFFALRIEPYLLATAEKYPDISAPIKEIAGQTLTRKIALVHGDISPKNILKGAENPVFLDAETAWYGDPAFDLAFCANHLLLKSVHHPKFSAVYKNCFQNFVGNYLKEVNWENASSLESRAARLLPVLLLARIDGKSPVEYLADETDKNKVRKIAQKFIVEPPDKMEIIAAEF